MAGTLQLSGTQTGLAEGSTQVVISESFTMSATDVVSNVSSSGANTVTVPSTAAACLITPPSANAATITLKGISADTGVALDPANASLLKFPATPPASFVLTCGSAPSGPIVIRFL